MCFRNNGFETVNMNQHFLSDSNNSFWVANEYESERVRESEVMWFPLALF